MNRKFDEEFGKQKGPRKSSLSIQNDRDKKSPEVEIKIRCMRRGKRVDGMRFGEKSDRRNSEGLNSGKAALEIQRNNMVLKFPTVRLLETHFFSPLCYFAVPTYAVTSFRTA